METLQRPIEEKISELENILTFMDTKIKLSHGDVFNYFGQKFPKIDMSFMSMQKKFDGVILPKFSWYNFIGKSMEDIRDRNYENYHFSSECSFDTFLTTPHPIQSHNPYIMDFPQWNLSKHPNFDEIKKDLKDEHRYTSIFSGNIPPEVIKFCINTQKVFSNIYLITESLNWENQELSTIDPLIVGVPEYVDFRNKDFYLLDKFDCTPDEDYVSREFSG